MTIQTNQFDKYLDYDLFHTELFSRFPRFYNVLFKCQSIQMDFVWCQRALEVNLKKKEYKIITQLHEEGVQPQHFFTAKIYLILVHPCMG